MPKFKLPVTWELCGAIEVEAATLQDAIDQFEPSDHETPSADEYVDGSFRLTDTDPEALRSMGYGIPIPGNPCRGAPFDELLKDEGILEEVTAAAKLRALQMGACAVPRPDQEGDWLVRRSDCEMDWLPAKAATIDGKMRVNIMSRFPEWALLEHWLSRGWDTWRQ